MGVGNNDRKFRYVNIKKGKIVIKEDGGIAEYGYIEGHLTDITIVEDEYKGKKYKKLCLELRDGIETFQLQMKLDSGYGRAFCCTIPNADLSKPIRITPTYKEDGEKQESGLFMNQDKPIKWAFTREVNNGRPDLEKITVRGEEMWDNTKQQAFYIDLLLNKIKPNLVHAAIAGPAVIQDQEKERGITITSVASTSEYQDDLPF